MGSKMAAASRVVQVSVFLVRLGGKGAARFGRRPGRWVSARLHRSPLGNGVAIRKSGAGPGAGALDWGKEEEEGDPGNGMGASGCLLLPAFPRGFAWKGV